MFFPLLRESGWVMQWVVLLPFASNGNKSVIRSAALRWISTHPILHSLARAVLEQRPWRKEFKTHRNTDRPVIFHLPILNDSYMLIFLNFILEPPAPAKTVVNPFAIERPHAAPHLLERQGSFRGLSQLNQSSPFKRQMSLRIGDLPSTVERQQNSLSNEAPSYKSNLIVTPGKHFFILFLWFICPLLRLIVLILIS